MILVKWHILVGVLWGLVSPRVPTHREISPLLASCVPVSNSLRATAGSILNSSDWNFFFPTFPNLSLFDSHLFFSSLSQPLHLGSFYTCLKILFFSTHPFFSISHLSLFYLVLFPPNYSQLFKAMENTTGWLCILFLSVSVLKTFPDEAKDVCVCVLVFFFFFNCCGVVL